MKPRSPMLRALLVEDDVFFRGAVAQVLTSHFPEITVDEVGDGVAAMRHVADHKPHVVFLDISLPGKNGIALAHDIKAIDLHVCVVMLSSHDTPEHREAASREGADAYLYKGADHLANEIITRVANIAAATNPSPG